jgi:hypothetical protein
MHLTNLLLHTANSIILFLLLRAMTTQLWRPAFVAAFFAWHPMHVESVAWISERKDVLSSLFFLLTIAAYWRYTLLRGARRAPLFYGLAILLFALGLMAKPMLVTGLCIDSTTRNLSRCAWAPYAPRKFPSLSCRSPPVP